MSLGKRFAWVEAERRAEAIVDKLTEHCECEPFDSADSAQGKPAICIVGSIRRGQKWVTDIDIVAIPKMASKDALFGEAADVAGTDFYKALRGELWDLTADGPKVIRGKSYIGTAASIGVDIYVATPESWATLLLIRTGSVLHNIWLCSRAIQIGGKLNADGSGLLLPGQYDPVKQCIANMRVVKPRSEEEIFAALALGYVEPRERECFNARPIWMPQSHGGTERRPQSNEADVLDAAAGER